jgi:hypothetical protein
MRNSKLTPNLARIEKTLLQKSYLIISHNITDNWLYVKWKGERSKENMMEGAEFMLQFVEETGCHKIINDSTEYTQAWPNIIGWVADEFVPRLEKAGIQYFAWIYDDKNLAKVPADAILKREKSDIMVMVFDNVPTAETWLRSIH